MRHLHQLTFHFVRCCKASTGMMNIIHMVIRSHHIYPIGLQCLVVMFRLLFRLRMQHTPARLSSCVHIAYDFSTGWPCTDGPRASTPDKNKRAIGQKTTVIHHPTLLSFKAVPKIALSMFGHIPVARVHQPLNVTV